MIFVDASAWYARLNDHDEHHAEALAAWPALCAQRMCTSSHVLYETAEAICRGAAPTYAAAVIGQLLTTRNLTLFRPTTTEEQLAVDLLVTLSRGARGKSRRLGYRDCLSFAIMKTHGVRRAFSFDGHFDLAGFTPWPAPH